MILFFLTKTRGIIMILKGARVTKENPEYDLGEIQYLIEENQCGITETVRTTAHKIGFS